MDRTVNSLNNVKTFVWFVKHGKTKLSSDVFAIGKK